MDEPNACGCRSCRDRDAREKMIRDFVRDLGTHRFLSREAEMESNKATTVVDRISKYTNQKK